MDATTLSGFVGVGLSLAFSYIPGLSDNFEKLETTSKRLVMGLLLVVAAVAVFILGCTNVYAGVTCDQGGATGLVNVLIAALVANQATYMISPPKQIKPIE